MVFAALASGDPDFQLVLGGTPIDPEALRPALIVASVGETLVGGMLVLSAAALAVGRDRFGVAVGRAGLVLGLGGVNVVLGYVDAETVVAVVVIELVLLSLYHRYRLRFLPAPRSVAPGVVGRGGRRGGGEAGEEPAQEAAPTAARPATRGTPTGRTAT